MVVCNSTLSETHWEVDPVAGNLTLHTLGWIICMICAIISTGTSFFLMYKHAINYTKPSEQRQILRILLMIPVYSVTTMFSYIWYWHAIYWEVGRDCYEAFAIAAFFALLCQYMGEDLKSQKEFFATMAVDPWPWPITWMNKCCKGKLRSPRSGLTWFNIIWISVFQYCFVRVITTAIATATQVTGDYCEDSLHPAFAHFWMMFFNIISVSVAMYMLIAFYMNTKKELAPNKPLLKLLCIKLVIFFSFWQMILLDFLSSANVIKPNRKMSQGDISIGINALLICFEMIIFSVMHLWAFPWKDYCNSDMGSAMYSQPPRSRAIKALVDTFNPFDIVKAFARGMKWSVVGHKHRHEAAEKIAARRKKSITAYDEEGQGLVANAGGIAGMPGTFGQGVYGHGPEGLMVHHPSPSDHEPMAHEIPTHGFVETEHSGYRPPPVELQASIRPSSQEPDISQHPAFATRGPGAGIPGYVNSFDNTLPPQVNTSLPYPPVSSMPGPRLVVPGREDPSPYGSQELLGSHHVLGGTPGTNSPGFAYTPSLMDDEGVYRGPNPRRTQEPDDRPSRVV